MPDTRSAYHYLAGIYLPIAIGVFSAIVLVLLYLVIRGARRTAADQRSRADKLEYAFIALLAGVVVVLVTLTFRTETPIDTLVSRPQLRVEVTAAQWSWTFRYANGKTVTDVSTWRPPVAVVPTNVEIEFDGVSQDVIHGFWIPQLYFMRQFLPGLTTRFDLIFRAPGLYDGECSVYCGEQHQLMHFAIRAVSADAFVRWMGQRASSASGARA